MQNKKYPILTSMISMCIMLSSFTLIEQVAPKPVSVRLTLQEVQILRQVLEQIELGTQEVGPFLEITKPIDQLLETTTLASGVEPSAKRVVLRLPLEAANNLLIFIQRANIPALGAKQIDTILKKVENRLSKSKAKEGISDKKVQLVTLTLTPLEARLTQHMLDQIEIAVSEVVPFLDIYLPLEQGNTKAADNQKDITLKLPTIAPRNLLLFLGRTNITGQQAKVVYGIIEKLQRLVANSQGQEESK